MITAAPVNAMDMNTALVESRSNKDWPQAYRILEPILLEADSPLRGWALMQLAITEYAQTPRAVLASMRHVDQALALSSGKPALTARTLVQGMNCAKYAADQAKYRTYANAARVLLQRGEAEALPWHAHLLIWVGYHCEDSGRPVDAEPCYLQAVKASVRHGSPFSPQDALCMQRLALTALADLQWRQGRQLEAVANLQRALSIPLPGRRGDTQYLKGRMAQSGRRYDDALEEFAASITLAAECRDHVLVAKASEAMVHCLSEAGRKCEIADWMRPVIRDAAHAELDHVVNRLQRLVRDLTK